MEATPTDSGDRGRRRRFTCDVARPGDATVVTLRGELDIICADAFKRRFSDATEDEPAHVVLDVRDLTFIDSTGLALILGVNAMAQDEGFDLTIVSTARDAPNKIFRMTGMDRVLPLVEELPDRASRAD
jgi:anti-sigma B factor antagonist